MADLDRNVDEEERLRREQEMEDLLLRQQEEVEFDEDEDDDDEEDRRLHGHPFHGGDQLHDERELGMEEPSRQIRMSYVQASFGAALGVFWYALRTRQQWYLALVFLSSSKWAYIVLGNAVIALCISLFRFFTKLFLGGLRLVESEGLGDFFRWNVTETCLALTMFRSEITVHTCILFLFLVLFKCLHWVVELREGHLRMTEEAVIPVQRGFLRGFPILHNSHVGIWNFLQLLIVLDVAGVAFCARHIYLNGPSVYILFGFEAAILLVTSISLTLLWDLHVLDGALHFFHEETSLNVTRLLHAWKDRKATVVFAIELQAQGAKFLAYVTFFGVVLTYYGLPINLFREVYMSFQSLKSRLLAFAKYRKLMASMNRFESIISDEELDQVGRTCIICRDDMTLGDSKKLPGCGHAFHKSCLREWLVQQQTCPTCRGDISAMEARARQERQRQAQTPAAAVEAPLLEQQEHQDQQVQPVHPPATAPVEGEPRAAAADPVRVAREVPADLAKRTTKSTPAEFPLETPLEQHIFPGLYQVSAANGARVIRDDGTVHRLILSDTGVVVTGSKWQVVKLEDDTTQMRLFLQVPDGWIPENELKPLMQLPKT